MSNKRKRGAGASENCPTSYENIENEPIKVTRNNSKKNASLPTDSNQYDAKSNTTMNTQNQNQNLALQLMGPPMLPPQPSPFIQNQMYQTFNQALISQQPSLYNHFADITNTLNPKGLNLPTMSFYGNAPTSNLVMKHFYSKSS
jgi:hypothetical protein